uniref:Uncharacterized protein n=1 Tax=Anguilla anguilla TaxID=7936 RepID=A0A0E9WSX1_ANGAN
MRSCLVGIQRSGGNNPIYAKTALYLLKEYFFWTHSTNFFSPICQVCLLNYFGVVPTPHVWNAAPECTLSKTLTCKPLTILHTAYKPQSTARECWHRMEKGPISHRFGELILC